MNITRQAMGNKAFILMGAAMLALAGCENMPDFATMMKGKTGGTSIPGVIDGPAATLTIEERDVEAPEVFELTDSAIWDGRPSFGGVWAAVPGNIQPERVRLENTENGQSTVGALFKREEANPGPAIEVSSDAAAALGIIPGQPVKLKIVALRRETVDTTPAIDPSATPGVIATTALDPVPSASVDDVTVAPLDDTASTEPLDTTTLAATIEDAEVPTAAAPPRSPLNRPFVQVGTFVSPGNAEGLVEILARDGVSSEVRSETMQNGKVLYRVVAGPSASEAERSALQARIIGLGFTDAFAVAN